MAKSKSTAGKPAKKAAAKKKRKAPARAKRETEPAPSTPQFEHPEGLFTRLSALRNDVDTIINAMSRGLGFPEIRLPRIELPPATGIADVRFEVSDSDERFEVSAELPGLGAEDVDVAVSKGMLIVEGEKADSREEKDEDYIVSERRYGKFTRSFRLPDSVDENKITADFQKGVLTIAVPKKAEAQPKSKRKIPVKPK